MMTSQTDPVSQLFSHIALTFSACQHSRSGSILGGIRTDCRSISSLLGSEECSRERRIHQALDDQTPAELYLKEEQHACLEE